MAEPTPDIIVETSLARSRDDSDRLSGRGWLIFAGTVLGVAGIMRIIDSLWAFGYKGSLPDDLKDSLLGDDLSHYGWTWLIVGAVMFVCSFLVLLQVQFARWFGMIAAALAAISAIFAMPYYPVWSLVYILIALLVIYALARYGGEDEPA
jgi:hypothetical protein